MIRRTAGRGGGARPPVLVFVLGGAFLLLIVSLLIGSFTTPEFPPYAVTVPDPLAPSRQVRDSLVGPAVHTLDASATDRWRHFSFSRNALVDPGTDWDVAFRRFRFIAGERAAIRDLGPVAFDSVGELPADGYQGNVVASDTTNPAVGKWYRYSSVTHLLTSKRHVYGIRTADGKYAKLEILAYYCKDAGTACITFRYAYQGDGSRRVARWR